MMKIEKQVSVSAMTTDGKKMFEGNTYVFTAYDKCLCGIYRGFAKKGALVFEGVIESTKVTFNVHPKAISSIYEIEPVKYNQDLPF